MLRLSHAGIRRCRGFGVRFGVRSRDLEKILALDITDSAKTTAGDVPVGRQITRCEDGCGDDDGLLAVLLALFVHEFSPARMGGSRRKGTLFCDGRPRAVVG